MVTGPRGCWYSASGTSYSRFGIFKIGDSLDKFRRVEAVLDAAGVAALYVASV
jgi:hypothetical protein